MLALALVLAVPFALWLVRAILDVWLGEEARPGVLRRRDWPPPWRRGAPALSPWPQRLNRVVTYAALAAVIIGFPLLRGESVGTYYAGFFPVGDRPREAVFGAAAAVLYLALLYVAWTATEQVRFRVRHNVGRLVRRLAGVPPTAVLVALVEELLFRAVLLADLLRDFRPAVAVGVGALVFAAAHYVRGAKRYWTFPGHVVLGVLFCVAFLWTKALWLPLGLHAGGVLLLMGLRPFVRYTGPGWLIGASIFPYAGLIGMLALLALTLNIWLRFGGA